MTEDTQEKSTVGQPSALTNAQKKYLRKLGHSLSPVIYIGKEGFADSVIGAINDALTHHELIKIKIVNTSQVTKHEAAARLPELSGGSLVQLIGKTLLIYRSNPERKKEERIKLP